MSRLALLAIKHYGEQHQSNFVREKLINCRVVCVIMAISSLVFYGLAFRVPAVCKLTASEEARANEERSKNDCFTS